MKPAEMNRLCQQAGAEGALWRLIRSWDPDKVAQWLQREKHNGVTPQIAVHLVAEVMAGAAFVLAQQLSGDRRGAILGDQGLINVLRASVAHKLDQVGGLHNIITPTKPKIVING